MVRLCKLYFKGFAQYLSFEDSRVSSMFLPEIVGLMIVSQNGSGQRRGENGEAGPAEDIK